MDPFEAQRGLMFAIAYRMLGSAMEAEDILQEAYLRYRKVLPESIESPRAFLATLVTRLCLNALQSAQAKREMYVGPWLPEPILTAEGELPSPVDEDTVHESISVAFLILLESLTPVERAVFVLREAFDYEYGEIAQILGKEEAACRQLYSRAKKHIAEGRPRYHPSPLEHRQMLDRFARASGDGDLDGLIHMLAEDVTMWADGGGKARGAATKPLHGRAAVAQFVLSSVRFAPPEFTSSIEVVNGEQALVLRAAGKAAVVIFIKIEGGLITKVWAMGNPDKLTHV